MVCKLAVLQTGANGSWLNDNEQRSGQPVILITARRLDHL